MFTLELIGGGRMGEALLTGLLSSSVSGLSIDDVVVVEVDPGRRDHLQRRFPGIVFAAEPVAAEGVIVATKPAGIAAAAGAAADAGCRRLLSIAAGIDLATLQEAAGPGVAVVRAMPNTPALVGAGAAAISAGEQCSEDDIEWAESIMAAVGLVVRVPESSMDAVTGLSGSGPAYVFLIAEALIDAGVYSGLPRATAELLATQTLLGAAQLLADSDDGPEALRAMVTSPGGTTAAGLRVLEERAVRAAVIDAVDAAAHRSAELGS